MPLSKRRKNFGSEKNRLKKNSRSFDSGKVVKNDRRSGKLRIWRSFTSGRSLYFFYQNRRKTRRSNLNIEDYVGLNPARSRPNFDLRCAISADAAISQLNSSRKMKNSHRDSSYLRM